MTSSPHCQNGNAEGQGDNSAIARKEMVTYLKAFPELRNKPSPSAESNPAWRLLGRRTIGFPQSWKSIKEKILSWKIGEKNKVMEIQKRSWNFSTAYRKPRMRNSDISTSIGLLQCFGYGSLCYKFQAFVKIDYESSSLVYQHVTVNPMSCGKVQLWRGQRWNNGMCRGRLPILTPLSEWSKQLYRLNDF